MERNRPSGPGDARAVGGEGTGGPGGPTFNVTAHGDHATAIGQVIITALQPELQAQEVFKNQRESAGYHTQIAVHIDAAYAAESLYVRATAPSIQRMTVLPNSGTLGRSRETPSRDEPGLLFATIPRPRADHVVDVFTAQPDDINVYCALNEQHPTLPKAGDVIGGFGFGV